jgi:hypothetical protein
MVVRGWMVFSGGFAGVSCGVACADKNDLELHRGRTEEDSAMAFDAQVERTADHIGPADNVWDIYDLLPVTVDGQEYGPRHRPVNDVPDPGGWRSGMPYGQQAWANP